MTPRRIFLFFTLLVLGFLLWFRSGWISFLPSLLPGLAKILVKNKDLIASLSNLVSIIFGLAALILAYRSWIAPRKPPKETPSPLRPQTAGGLLKAYIPPDFQIEWVDRPIPTLDDLKDYHRLILIGPSKIGKTRAAIILIGQAESALLPENRLFDLDPEPFKSASDQEISRLLCQDILPGPAVLLFIDNLPQRFIGDSLDRLSVGLNCLEQHSRLYVIATARQDQLNPESRAWLFHNNFHIMLLSELDSTQIVSLINAASLPYGLQLDDQACQVFIDRSDGTPELTLLGLHAIKTNRKFIVDHQTADRYAGATQLDAIRRLREELVEDFPPILYLLQALDVYYIAGLNPPYRTLVMAFSSHLWRMQAPHFRVFNRSSILSQALYRLIPYGVLPNEERLLIQKDILFEVGQGPYPGIKELYEFLFAYKRGFANSLLRRFYLTAHFHAHTMYSLAKREYISKDLTLSLICLTHSLKLDPTKAYAWSNHGLVLFKLDRLNEALESYNRAVTIDPKEANIWSNRGVVLTRQIKYQEALSSFDRSLGMNPEYAEALYNKACVYALMNNPERSCADLKKAIDLDKEYIGIARSDNDFDIIRNHPCIRSLLTPMSSS